MELTEQEWIEVFEQVVDAVDAVKDEPFGFDQAELVGIYFERFDDLEDGDAEHIPF